MRPWVRYMNYESIILGTISSKVGVCNSVQASLYIFRYVKNPPIFPLGTPNEVLDA